MQILLNWRYQEQSIKRLSIYRTLQETLIERSLRLLKEVGIQEVIIGHRL